MQNTHLADEAQRLVATAQAIHQKVQAMPPSLHIFIPRAGAWSALQVVAHLRRANRTYLPYLERAIQKGKEKQVLATGPHKPGWFGSWLAKRFEPDQKPYKAPKAVQPQQGELDAARVLESYARSVGEYARLAQEAEGLDTARLSIRFPLSPINWPSLRLGDLYTFVANHNARHLQQLERLEASFAQFKH